MITRIMSALIIGLVVFASLGIGENAEVQVSYPSGYYVQRPHYVGGTLYYFPGPVPYSYSYTYYPTYTYSYRPYYPPNVYWNYRPYSNRPRYGRSYVPRRGYSFSYYR